MTIPMTVIVLTLFASAALAVITFAIGTNLANKRRYSAGFDAGMRYAYRLQAEDKKLNEQQPTRAHSYYGHTEPKRAPSPRDW